MKSEKGRSELNKEKRNRKDVHIDQYRVDRQHERSGGDHDREERRKRDEKEMKRGTYLRIMRNMIRPKEGEVKGGDR
jgi:hypothetical protein